MINQETIEDLANRLTQSLPEGLAQLKQEAGHNFQAILETGLAQLNLVTREEFDAQCAVLRRTQDKLVQIEQQLEALSSTKSP